MVIRKADPGNQNRLVRVPDVGRALGGVEVKAVVQIVIAAVGGKGQRVIVHFSQEIDIVIRAFGASRKFRVLRGEDQHVRPADVHNIGALPHAAEFLIAGDFQLSRERPAFQQLFGLVDQHRPALIHRLRADKDIILFLVRVPDNFRVPLMFLVVVAGAKEGPGKFLEFPVFIQHGGAGVGNAGPVLVAVVAGVVEIELPVYGDRGTGVRPPVVILAVGFQADALIAPVHEVRAGDVIPVFQTVDRAPRAPLIAQVPFSLMEGKAVRIAGQARYRLHMIRLPVDRGFDLLIQVPDFVGAFQFPVTLFPCPLFFHASFLLIL